MREEDLEDLAPSPRWRDLTDWVVCHTIFQDVDAVPPPRSEATSPTEPTRAPVLASILSSQAIQEPWTIRPGPNASRKHLKLVDS